MKKLFIGVVITATQLFATNGSSLIGMGPKSCGMGGVGIGMSHGAESSLINPALISSVEGSEISFAGTIFIPDVEYQGSPVNSGYAKSDSAFSLIPKVAFVHNLDNQFYTGIGMWGTAGMGVKYNENSSQYGTMQMGTNMQIVQFGVPLAYKSNNFTFGVAAIVQYGSLDIDYQIPIYNSTETQHVGGIMSQDVNFGYIIGVSYQINNLTLGGVYKSSIDMIYDGVMTTAVKPFESAGVTGITDHLETPAEYGVGVAYTLFDNHTLAFDYKTIRWEEAKGYKDFNWKNQSVYAIGYEYKIGQWSFRGGYNHSDQPIDSQMISINGGAALNQFNLLGAPAIVENHYSIGTTYEYSNSFAIDTSVGHSPEATQTFQTAHVNPETNELYAYNVSAKHTQYCVTLGINYKFSSIN